MQQRARIENLPQTFIPNSNSEKKAELHKAHQALKKAKAQGKKVVFIKQGVCAFSMRNEPREPKQLNLISGKIYSTVEAAKFLGINPNCLNQHKKMGKVKPEKKIRGKLFYSAEELERFNLERNKNKKH